MYSRILTAESAGDVLFYAEAWLLCPSPVTAGEMNASSSFGAGRNSLLLAGTVNIIDAPGNVRFSIFHPEGWTFLWPAFPSVI